MNRHLYKLNLLLALAFFIFLSTRDLESPGIQYDETLQAHQAVNLIKSIPDDSGEKNSIAIRSHRFPIMTMEYMGAVKSYLLAIVFSIFGIKTSVLRLTMIVIAAIGLYCATRFAHLAFGQITAAVCIWLMATDPTLLVCARNDWGPVSIAFALRGITLFLLARWWKSGGRRLPLLGASAAIGFGIYDKANFFWFVFALIPVLVIFWWIRKDRPRANPIDIALALATMLAASFPFWIYNLLNEWPTWRSLTNAGSMVRVLNLAPERLMQLVELFNGHALDKFMFGERLNSHLGLAERFPLFLTILAFLFLVVTGILKKKWHFLALPALVALILIQILTNPKFIWLHHWITLYPLQHLMLVQAIKEVWRLSDVGLALKVARPAMVVCVIFAIFTNLMTLGGYHSLFHKREGVFPWNDAIYPLAETLQSTYSGRHIQFMDWGIAFQVQFLSAGKIPPQEPYWSFPPDRDVSKRAAPLRPLVSNPSNVFVLLTDRPKHFIFPPPRPYLDEAARAECAAVKSERQIVNQAGKPAYLIIEYLPGQCKDIKP
jgi:hypothetical protein